MWKLDKKFLLYQAVLTPTSGDPNAWLNYARFIYPFAISVAAILAVVMLIIAGLEMMTVSEGMRSDAKQKIQNALLGLLLAVGAYLILRTVNPDLLNLKINTSKIRVQVQSQNISNPPTSTNNNGTATQTQGSCVVDGKTFSLTQAQCDAQKGDYNGCPFGVASNFQGSCVVSGKTFNLTKAQCVAQKGDFKCK